MTLFGAQQARHFVGRRRDLAAFNQLLDRLNREAGERSALPPLVDFVSSRTRDLRPWPVDRLPSVVAIGTEGWEREGMWPTLARHTDFSLFDYGRPEFYVYRRKRLCGEATRARIARAFLKFLNDRPSNAPVDLVFIYASGWHVESQLLRTIRCMGIRTVILGLDDKHQFFRPWDRVSGQSHQERVARECDVYWTSWPLVATYLRGVGRAGWYAPSGADPTQYVARGSVHGDPDVFFMGAAYGYRRTVVERLAEAGLQVEAYGRGWRNGFISHGRALRMMANAKIVLGVGGVGHLSEVLHLKGRDFEVPMAGGCYLTSYNPELADHFSIGEEILCYSSIEQCLEIAHALVRDPRRAEEVSKAGRERCLGSHTWDRRFRDLFALFGARRSDRV